MVQNKRFARCRCGFVYEHKKGSPLCRLIDRVFCEPQSYLTKGEVEKLIGKKITNFKTEVCKS